MEHPISRFLLILPLFAVSTAIAQEDYSDIVRAAKPGVVTIAVFDSTGRLFGKGSGFFIDHHHIITSRHVVQGATRAEFRTSSGRIFAVKGICGDDPAADLAVLHVQIPGDVVHTLTLASAPVEIGAAVIVIGSPLGLELTVSNGIVSSRRALPRMGQMLQITAPVSQGSSGGPVLNRQGEVVGVTSAVLMKGQNLNFATPIERLKGMRIGQPVSFDAWRSAETEHAVENPEVAELAKDSATAQFLSDYAFERGMEAMSHRDYPNAIDFFRTAISMQPKRGDAYYQAGVCEVIMRHYGHAEEIFRRGVKVAPGHVSMWYRMGRCQSLLDRPADALTSLREAYRLDSTYPPVWEGLAMVYVALGNDSTAIPFLRSFARAMPADVPSRMDLGTLLVSREEFPEAAELFRQILRIDSTSDEAIGKLGVVYARMEKFADALPLLQRGVLSRPDDLHLRMELGYALYELKRCAEAERELMALLRRVPENALARFHLGNTYLCLKKYDQAVREFTEAIRIEPDNPTPHYALGALYATVKKDKTAALDEYKILQRLDPAAARMLFEQIYPR